ncbi:Ger(x)C family spore germination protein [Bacillus tianshenii]|nr:Ger(x)C family spore germination protein [Bacillus tianshenii]
MKAKFLSIFLCLLLLTGCWDRIEVNDLAVVVGVGIDRVDNEHLKLTLLLINPGTSQSKQVQSGADGGSFSTTVVSGVGTSIGDAIPQIQEKLSREIFWGHHRIAIIGKKAAEYGVREEIDFFARHPVTRLRSQVFISEGTAEEMLRTPPILERSVAEVLREIAKLKLGIDLTVKEFLEMLEDKSQEAVVPLVVLDQEEEETMVMAKGSALLKNGKLIGMIDDKVTRGVLWLRDEIDLAYVTVQPKGTDGYVSMLQIFSRTKFEPHIENGKWSITVRIETKNDIIQNGTPLKVSSEKVYKQLEKEVEREIKHYTQLALEEARKHHADIFDFSEHFHQKYPDRWHNIEKKNGWEEKFNEIEVKVHVNANITRTGLTTSPPAFPDDEEVTD